jgi:arylsulfatase A-like enzyme
VRGGAVRVFGVKRAVALLTLLVTSCGEQSSPGARNVLVVLVDTLRADRLSLYGYERPTSPELDRVARARGVVFRNAWANAGCTYPSVNSILTSRWPQYFAQRYEQVGKAIPAELTTMAEWLAGAGYDTAAVSASSVVRATPGRFNRWGGFDAGFERFDERCAEREAACVTRAARDFLGQMREPFFLYLHYLDPHNPYRPPPGAVSSFAAESAAAAALWARTGNGWPIQQKLYQGETDVDFDEDDVRHLSDLYDDEIRYLDAELGNLMAHLEQRELLERTIVLFLSDHGEELFENGHWAHCKDLAFETVLATPLVAFVPGLAAGWRETAVSNIDVLPTVLDLLEVEFDRHELDGESLEQLLRRGDGAGSRRYLFAAQGRTRAAREAFRRVTVDLRDFEPHFDSVGPPPFAAALNGGRDEALLTALRGWIRRLEANAHRRGLEEAERIERDLRALGYL